MVSPSPFLPPWLPWVLVLMVRECLEYWCSGGSDVGDLGTLFGCWGCVLYRACSARSKRRGFSPGATAHHSQSARVQTDFFFHIILRKKIKSGRRALCARDVCCVLFLFYLSICVCVCLQVQGPLRECLRAGRYQASLLLHTICARSWCIWRDSCVAAKHPKKKRDNMER